MRCVNDSDCMKEAIASLLEDYDWYLLNKKSGLKDEEKLMEAAQMYQSGVKSQ